MKSDEQIAKGINRTLGCFAIALVVLALIVAVWMFGSLSWGDEM